MDIRAIQLIKIGNVTYNLAKVPVNPNLRGVHGIFVFSKRDGTDPVVIQRIPTGWACSCSHGIIDQQCIHIQALRAVGQSEIAVEAPASTVEADTKIRNAGVVSGFINWWKDTWAEANGQPAKALPPKRP